MNERPVETGDEEGVPGSYEWLQRGLGLLEGGHAAAAATVLERVASEEPRSASVLEALGRAQFTAGRPGAAVRTFERLAEVAPDSDYARFGYGQSLRRVGRLPQAAEQLALAVAMRPQRAEYVEALTRVRELLAPRASTRLGAPDQEPRSGAGAGIPPGEADAGLVVVRREPGPRPPTEETETLDGHALDEQPRQQKDQEQSHQQQADGQQADGRQGDGRAPDDGSPAGRDARG